MFPDGERYRINPVKIYFSSQIRYTFQTNVIIPHAGHKNRREIYTQLYWDWDIGELHMLLCNKCVHNRGR